MDFMFSSPDLLMLKIQENASFNRLMLLKPVPNTTAYQQKRKNKNAKKDRKNGCKISV